VLRKEGFEWKGDQPPFFQVSAHVKRIEAVEKDLKALSGTSASREDISRVRAEFKKLYDGLHVGELQGPNVMIPVTLMILPTEFLDLRSHVWGIRELSIPDLRSTDANGCNTEQDVHSVLKKESTTVRI
jgi:hypothetical protein